MHKQDLDKVKRILQLSQDVLRSPLQIRARISCLSDSLAYL